MTFQHSLDSLPIVGVFALFSVAALLTAEAGYRFGRWWQDRSPSEKEGATAMIVGSLLALMAFLLAVTMGMASDRFAARRSLVLAEANAIGTTYLRAGYLPEPASSETRALLHEYVPLRIVTSDRAELRRKISRSAELHAAIWSIAEAQARAEPRSSVLAVYIESLNAMIDLHETRIATGLYARVPDRILMLLLAGSMLTLSMVGYNAGLNRRRSSVSGVMLILLLGAVTTLVIDLDRPRDGFLTVNQQPLVDLAHDIGAPLPNDPPGAEAGPGER